MDEHTRGEELGLQTEGSYLTEEEIRALHQTATEVDYPMPGEVADKEKEKEHTHTMPEGEIQIIEEDGRRHTL